MFVCRVFGDAIVIGGGDGEAPMLSTGMPRPSSYSGAAAPSISRASPHPGAASSSNQRGSNATTGASSHTSSSPLHDDSVEGGSRHNSSASTNSTVPGSARNSSVEVAAPTSLSLVQQMPKGEQQHQQSNK